MTTENIEEGTSGGSALTVGLERVHECPNPACGYLVADTAFLAARFDYPCPRCNKSNLSGFFIRQIKPSNAALTGAEGVRVEGTVMRI